MSNKDLIHTTHQLKKVLESVLDEIRELDIYKAERSKTASYKKPLIEKHLNKCAKCQSSTKIEAAHILPLEIGGRTTEENLILLCQNHHRQFDSGLISINRMKKVHKLWISGIPIDSETFKFLEERDSTIKPIIASKNPEVNSILDFITKKSLKKHYRSAIKHLNAFLNSKNLELIDEVRLRIKIAELSRRRNSKDSLTVSSRLLNSLPDSMIPEKIISSFRYEKMYVNRLTGNHNIARDILLNEIERMKNSPTEITIDERVSIKLHHLLCDLALIKDHKVSELNYFNEQITQLEEESYNLQGHWGQRLWRNCVAHKLQVLLKFRHQSSFEQWEKLKDAYLNLDVNNGWSSSLIPSISLFEALTLLFNSNSEKELEDALHLFVRTFMSRLNPSRRFEGIRDSGFGISICLKKLGIKQEVQLKLESTMQKVVDGTSYIWPYVNIYKE